MYACGSHSSPGLSLRTLLMVVRLLLSYDEREVNTRFSLRKVPILIIDCTRFQYSKKEEEESAFIQNPS